MKKRTVAMILTIFFLSLSTVVAANTTVSHLNATYRKPLARQQQIVALIENRDVSIPDLINLLADKRKAMLSHSEGLRDMDTRITAVNLLGELKDKRALPQLNNLLTASDDPSLIFNAARSIGKIGGAPAFIILSRALSGAAGHRYNQNKFVKRAAVLGLGLCGDDRAIPLLLQELNNSHNSQLLRIYAAGSLGLLGSAAGLETAIAGVSSQDSQIKHRAIQALGIIGDEASINVLSREARSQSYLFKNSAHISLLKIKYNQLGEREKVDFIQRHLLKNPRNRSLVAWGTSELAGMDTGEALSALETISSDPKQETAGLKNAAKMHLILNRNR